ncbi:hypothetical protein F4774DRAFT_415992 [Daldinia eschscholtzii]|nr:hypothetical protein F4774DRAFT_415992 [Daldinia eschscholtzii]
MAPRRVPRALDNPYLHRIPCEPCFKRKLAQYAPNEGNAFTWRCYSSNMNQTACRPCAKSRDGCVPHLVGTLGDVEAVVRIVEFVNPYFTDNQSWVPRDGYVDAPEWNLLNYQLNAAFRIRLAHILDQLLHGFFRAHALHNQHFFPKTAAAFTAQENYRVWVQRRREYLLTYHRREDYSECNEPMTEWTAAIQPRLMPEDEGYRHWYGAKRLFLFELTDLFSSKFGQDIANALVFYFPIIPGQLPGQEDPLEFQSGAEGGGGGPGQYEDGEAAAAAANNDPDA